MTVPSYFSTQPTALRVKAAPNLLTHLFLLSLLLPLAVPLASFGDKPVDLIPADLLLGPVMLWIVVKRVKTNLLPWFIALVALGLISLMVSLATTQFPTFTVTATLSMLRLYKCVLYGFVGTALASIYHQRQLFRILAIGSLICIATLVVSDVLLTRGFPTTRWGSSFAGLEVFGHPNSPAVFFLVLVFLALVQAPYEKGLLRILLIGGSVLGTAIAILTLSRSAAIGAAIFWLLFLLRGQAPLWTKAIVITLILAGLYGMAAGGLFEMLESRIDRTLNYGDATSGRTEVWFLAFDLIADRPVLGYGFQPFSDYSARYDTPHNQYLEILYKGGIISFALFFFPMAYFTIRAFFSSDPATQLFAALCIAVAASNVTQPNLTYAPTASALLLIGGFLWVYLQEPTSAKLLRQTRHSVAAI